MKTKSTFNNILFLSLVFYLKCVSILNLNGQTTHHIEVSSNVFSPNELTIMPGDTVTWNNVQGFHNVNGTTEAYPDNPESFGNNTGSGWTYSHVFTLPGVYNYHCDPHVGLGMTGKITVEGGSLDMLTVNFLNMDPHLNQDLWLSVKNQETGEEIERIKTTVQTEFSIEVNGLVTGQAYYIDFYADHNHNGRYDIPPTDHAWRIEIDNFQGNESVDFTHNTIFTDIEWMHKVTINLQSMNPHIGQQFTLFFLDSATNAYVDTIKVDQIPQAEFSVQTFNLQSGKSYQIDFYADHNGNNMYDAPPTDHAWRMQLNNLNGDTLLNFIHNTSFTDIFAVTSGNRINLQEVFVYPNPVNGNGWINIDGFNASTLQQIEMYNVKGQLVNSWKFNKQQQQMSIKLPDVEPGVYVIQIISGDEHQIEKLIIR